MSYNVNDFIRQADTQIGRYAQHQSQFQALAEDCERRRAELQGRLEGACVQLADALIPDPSEPCFQALSDRLGLPELLALFRQVRLHEAQLSAKINAIEESESYTSREVVRGRAEHQLDEVKPLFDYAVKDLRYLDSLPRLRELVERSYGTPQYPHQGPWRYLSPEFLHDWKRSDEICETLKLTTFAEAVARYRDRQEETEVLGRTVRELQGRLGEIAQLEAERERLLAERAAQPGTLRRDAGKRLASVLQGTPGLVDGMEHPEMLRARIREIDGLEHQAGYLASLRLRVLEDAAQIEQRAEKLRAERQRYASDLHRYRNKTFAPEQFARRFGRDDRYDALYTRYTRTSQTVYVFQDYDRVGGLEDFLWWDVITGGRLNGGFIPEVQEYTAAHPDYAYDRSAFATAGGAGTSDFDPNFGGDAS